MEDNHEQFVQLARAKHDADDYGHIAASPEIERLARFFWWVVSGLFGATICVTIWVTNINSNMIGFEKRISASETYRDTTKARFTADDLTHLQTNQAITSIQETLKDRKVQIDETTEMWQMKIRGENNDAAFFREHGYPAPRLADSPPRNPK